MATDEQVLQYLYEEGKARQKQHIAEALNTSIKYIEAIMTKLRRKGLVKVSTHRGWWTLTIKGTAHVEGTDIKEPFFSKEEVNQSIPLRGLSNSKERNKASAALIQDNILQFFVGIYLIKHDLELPVGTELTDEEWKEFEQLTATINQMFSTSAVA